VLSVYLQKYFKIFSSTIKDIDMLIAKEIAKIIEDLCSKKGIAVNELLKECNLKGSVVDNMKKGSMPSVDKALIISRYFGVSIDYLLGLTENPNLSELQTIFAQLSPDEQRVALQNLYNQFPRLNKH